MLDTSSRASVRAAEKASDRLARDQGEVITGLMSSIQGRAWIWDLLESAHIFRTTFSVDSRTSAFLEGERNFGLRLLGSIMQWCPDLYLQAIRESNVRRTTFDNATSRPDSAAEHFGGADTDGRDQERTGIGDGDSADREDRY